MKLLALLLGEWVYVPFSFLIRNLLRIRGIKVGKGVSFRAVPFLKIDGTSKNIRIDSFVTFMGDVDLRCRENGKIHIGPNCRIDHGVRLVSARQALLSLGEGTRVGIGTVMNSGVDVSIGNYCMISGYVYIQSSNHGTKKGQHIQNQPHVYKPIKIGNDVLLTSHVTVLPGVSIGDGAVVGAKSVVTKDIPPNHIFAGIPAKSIGERN